MVDMNELQTVLKKVEDKLILSKKVYSALTYMVWMVIMAGYYLLIGLVREGYLFLTIVYWVIGVILYFLISGVITKNIVALETKNPKSRQFGICTMISWMLSSIFGWFVIPYYLASLNWNYLYALAVGLLSFISLANLGMILSIKWSFGRWEYEMYPGVIVPGLLIVAIPFVTIGPMEYAGMGVVVGYGLTVILYLYSAFKYAR